jgi:Protein of unknown function (DUF3489)
MCNAKEPTMSKRKSVAAGAAAPGANEEVSKALDRQMHSVCGAMSGALKKKHDPTITSEKTDDGRRVYRIAA